MKLLVIIPTYNEKENVEKIVGQITGKGFYLLVIDDNSPDGTGDILEKLKIKNEKLEVIHREKKLGLGTAYIQGFSRALQKDFDFIFTTDADFSHSPDYLPDFLKKLLDFDLVIGSRYIGGGGVKNWSIQRKIISRYGNFYAKTILRFPVTDCASGFMGFRRKVLKNVNLDEIKSEGYGFLIEMKYRAYKLGY